MEHTIYENYGPATRAVTIHAANAIYYAVEHLEKDQQNADVWVTVWSHTVPFQRDKAHRPAGHAFRTAARTQDIRAKEVEHANNVSAHDSTS